MAVIFALTASTPNRLRYTATTAPGGIQAGIIPNAGGASPDITTDLLAAAAVSGTIVARFLELMTTPVADIAAAVAVLIEGAEIACAITPMQVTTI